MASPLNLLVRNLISLLTCQLANSLTCQLVSLPTYQLVNLSTSELVNSLTCQLVNSFPVNSLTCELINQSTRQLVNSSTRPLIHPSAFYSTVISLTSVTLSIQPSIITAGLCVVRIICTLGLSCKIRSISCFCHSMCMLTSGSSINRTKGRRSSTNTVSSTTNNCFSPLDSW